MFKNIKISLRLLLSFGVLCLLLVLTVLVAWRGLERMGQASEALYQRSVMGGQYLAQTQESLWQLRNGIAQYMALTDPEARRKIIDDSPKTTENLRAAVSQFEKVNVHPEVTAKLRESKQAIDRYLDARAKVLVLFQEDKLEEARAFRNSTTTPAGSAMAKSVAELVTVHTAASQSNNDDAIKAEREARQQLVTLAAISIAMTVILSIAVTLSITRPLGDAVTAARQLSAGDLTVHLETQRKDEVGQLLAAMHEMTANLQRVIGEVTQSSGSLASSANQVSTTAQAISQATSEQAASVEQTSASVEQMSVSINQNTNNAKVTDGMSSQAAKQATAGGQAVKDTVAAMKSIAGKIGIIDDIAYQTNLLALNAAIEAARAGEHGKGFAVVAAEVRKLAERSQVAAQEISELASGSVDKAETAGKLLDEMVPSITKTSDLVQEIAVASAEQSSGVGQINTAMDQLNQITQQNASASEELAATAEEMSGQAMQLQDLMSFFKVEPPRA